MSYLTYEDLKEITNRTSGRVTKAQVIADLTAMKLPFEVNARGFPYSSMEALNKTLGLKTRNKTAVQPKPRQIKIG